MVNHCAALGCTNIQNSAEIQNKDITFHRFPKENSTYEQWITRINRMDRRTGKLWQPRRSVLCSEHFLPEDFIYSGSRRTLKHGVVPSIFLADPPIIRWSKKRQFVEDLVSDKNLNSDKSNHVPIRFDRLDHSYFIGASRKQIKSQSNNLAARLKILQDAMNEIRNKSTACSLPDSSRNTDLPADSTANPSADPTANPCADPTANPSADPAVNPSADSTVNPFADPTVNPSADPTVNPSADPTVDPSVDPPTYPCVDLPVEVDLSKVSNSETSLSKDSSMAVVIPCQVFYMGKSLITDSLSGEVESSKVDNIETCVNASLSLDGVISDNVNTRSISTQIPEVTENTSSDASQPGLASFKVKLDHNYCSTSSPKVLNKRIEDLVKKLKERDQELTNIRRRECRLKLKFSFLIKELKAKQMLSGETESIVNSFDDLPVDHLVSRKRKRVRQKSLTQIVWVPEDGEQ